MAQMLLTNTLLSYQKDRKKLFRRRLINIHIELSKRKNGEKEKTFLCVWRYLIELKTHARNEKRNSYWLFMFQMKQREEQKKTHFSHPVNTHTHIHR